jgi:capsule polysaccharide export protein KpsE/RkpR
LTPPRGIIGTIAESKLLNRALYRRLIVLVLITICAAFTLFPERYRAAVTMTPTDPSSLGLGGALGQLGALNSVFGNQAAIEISLKVARSMDVRRMVIERLKLNKRSNFANIIEADRWVKDKVSIRSLRGGIIQIEMLDQDSAFAQQMVSTFSDATRERLAEINRRQTAYKRDVLEKLVAESSDRLANAQAAYDSFRLTTRNAEPNFALASTNARIESIRAAIKGKEVTLNAARQFATDQNLSVQQILAELDALRGQLRDAQMPNPDVSGSVGRVVQQSTRVKELERQLAIARGLFDGYKRFLEGTAVEDLTSTASVRVLEPPFVDSARQYNLIPLFIGILLFLIWLAVEFYQLRRPVGSRAGPYDA